MLRKLKTNLLLVYYFKEKLKKQLYLPTQKTCMQDLFSISILIPTLNEEKYIEKCLNSIFCQTYHSNIIEIFIVDGGSIDRTVEIVNQLRPDHPNLFLLNNNKKIQAAAFNIGIDNFKGDIFIRLDAHCTYDTEYIYNCVQYHRSSEYGNVGGCWSIEPGSDSIMAKTIALVSSSRIGLGSAAYRVGKKIMLTDSVPFGAFTKKVLSVVGRMDESLPRGEDNEYNARIRKKGYKILFDPKIISYYYGPPDLNSFLNKIYSNGFSIGVLLRVSRESVSVRHLVPLMYILALGLGLSLSLFYSFFKFALLLLLTVYFLLTLLSGISKLSIQMIKLVPLYIYITYLVHLTYGIGILHGLIKGNYKARD